MLTGCEECARLYEEYSSASSKREWAKSDLIAAISSHDADAVKRAQLVKEGAVRQWELALVALQTHLKNHGE